MATPLEIVHLGRVASTQDEVRLRFEANPVLVTATGQEAGRGRSGAAWVDADRAMAASVAFRPTWPTEAWSRFPLVAGLAALDILPQRFGLKWPNDLMVDGAKAGGILVESDGDAVVVGFGLNIFWREPPPGMTGVHDSDPGEGHGRRVAERWAEALLLRSERDPRSWGNEEYAARCVTVGTRVTWEPDGSGLATGISQDGGLVVEREGKTEVIRSGEVRGLREA